MSDVDWTKYSSNPPKIDWTQYTTKPPKGAAPANLEGGSLKGEPLGPHVVRALVEVGFSHSGAKAIAAEVGRENDFRPELIFGSHSDPANSEWNGGMLSWQKERGKAFVSYMTKQGIMHNGKMQQTYEALVAQSKYLKQEMASGKFGGGVQLVEMLSQPTVDYQEVTKKFGGDYIKWRYNDPAYAEHHKRRDKYYQELGGNLPEVDWSMYRRTK